MNVQAKQYWVSGPPAGLYEGLLDSGLVTAKNRNKDISNVSATPVGAAPPKNIASQPKPKTANPNSSTAKFRSSHKPANFVHKNPNPESFAHYRPKSAVPLQQIGLSPSSNSSLEVRSRFPPLIESNVGNNNNTYNDSIEISNPQSILGDYSNVQRSFAGRKEAKALLQDLEMMISAFSEETAGISPTEQYNALSKLLSSYFLIWNKLIVQLRSHNEDHAIICQRIKAFVQDILKDMPQINKRYEAEINILNAKIDEQNIKMSEKDKEYDELNSEFKEQMRENNKLMTTIERAKNTEISSKEEHNDLLYKIEDQRVQIDELTFKIGKLEEKKTSLLNQIAQKDSIIENCQKQISQQEATITKYEDEGAGFRPLYQKAIDEGSQLKSEIENLKQEIAKMKSRDKLVDAETEPIFELLQEVFNSKSGKGKARKDKPKNGLPNNNTNSAVSQLNNLNNNKQNNLNNNKVVNSTTTKGNHDNSKNVPKFQINSLSANSSAQASPISSKRSDRISQLSDNRISGSNSKNDATSTLPTAINTNSINSISDNNNKLNNNTVQISNEIDLSSLKLTNENNDNVNDSNSKNNNSLTDSIKKSQELQVKKDNSSSIFMSDTKAQTLPDDYKVSKNVLDASTNSALLSYVDHLFPYPFTEHQSHPSQSQAFMSSLEKKYDAVKPFTWTLRQVVLILRNGFEVDSLSLDNVSFVDIIAKMLEATGKNSKIVDKIQDNLMRSLSHHNVRSHAIQFFMQFVMNEYSIIDYRFFSMLFTLCFPAIYPPIESVLEDPDLSDDFNLFYINRAFFDKICLLMLRLEKFPEENMENILKDSSTDKNDYPSLMSFWLFAREMLRLFKSVHESFHRQIKAVMKIIGSTDNDTITRFRFQEFMRIVEPNKSESEIKSMWEKMLLLGDEPGLSEANFSIFLKFCGDYPNLTGSIIELPKIERFEQKFAAMPEPCATLFFFMRKRYSDLIPRFMKSLPEEMREQLSSTLTKMRNSFLRCDISSSLVCYRHVMQLIDLKMTEMNPYNVFTINLTSEDVSRIINHMMMRECLASIMINIPPEDDPMEVIKNEMQMNKA